MTVDAATDSEIFDRFVREALVPVLKAGDVVVWDNLGPHKAVAARAGVEQEQPRLERLPPYSPDLSPIEPYWSKVKRHVRSAQPRAPDALGQAAAEGFASVTAADARGWFTICGYCLQ